MSHKFTVDTFREKLVEWAVDKEVKYIPADVYHMVLLREPIVAEFMTQKGYKPNVLANAIEKTLDQETQASGDQWVGNRHDVSGRESQALKEYREMIRIQKEAFDDPMLKLQEEEEDYLDKKMKLVGEITKTLRFASDEENAITNAEAAAALEDRDVTALDIYKHINFNIIATLPAVYKVAGLSDGINRSTMSKNEFWDSPKQIKAIDHFSQNVNDSTSDPEQKLTQFLKQNPDSADYLTQLIKSSVDAALNERFGPKPSSPDQKPNGP